MKIIVIIQGVKKTDYTNYLSTFNLVGLDCKRFVHISLGIYFDGDFLRWTEDTFHRALMAICLLKILKASKYFPHNNEDLDIFTNDELFVGSLIMRHLNVLQFNAHEIYELLRGDRRNMKPNKNLLIGLGVYPQVSVAVAKLGTFKPFITPINRRLTSITRATPELQDTT